MKKEGLKMRILYPKELIEEFHAVMSCRVYDPEKREYVFKKDAPAELIQRYKEVVRKRREFEERA